MKKNKLKLQGNLLKGIPDGTSFQTFVSFKHRIVENQMGKVKPHISAI